MSASLARRQLVAPDFESGPAYVDTYGPAVAELCAAVGYEPDPQQELVLDGIFAIRTDGTPAAFETAVIAERQALKTGALKMCAIGWLFVTDQRVIVWSSHELDTTNEARRELGEIITEAPTLSRTLPMTKNHGIYDANGQGRIELRSGQRILFKARTISGGRGLAGDKVVLDEYFAAKPSHVGSLIPTLATRRDAQVVYASSAGKKDSHLLREVRDRGRAGKSIRLRYLEWMIPKVECASLRCEHAKDAAGCALDREDLWALHPGVRAGRIPLERIGDFRDSMPPEEFMREVYGWWDDPEVLGGVFGPAWARQRVDAPQPTRVTFGLAVSHERDFSSVGAASVDAQGRVVLGAVERFASPAEAQAAVRDMALRTGFEVVVDGNGPAATLIEGLEDDGVSVKRLTRRLFAESCEEIYDGVLDETVVHQGHEELDRAVNAAEWSTSGEIRVFTRKASHGDISMLEAVTVAAKGARDELDYDVMDSLGALPGDEYDDLDDEDLDGLDDLDL